MFFGDHSRSLAFCGHQKTINIMNAIKSISSKFLAPIYMVACMFMLSACSNPTSIAQKILEEKVAEKSNGNFKMSEFKKTDAISSTKNGVEMYTVKYTATIEALKDGTEFAILENRMIVLSINPNGIHYDVDQKTKAGQKFYIQGDIELVKHEQGWVQNLHNGGDGNFFVKN